MDKVIGTDGVKRIGKVKIYTEEGKFLRHGQAREADMVYSILGIWTVKQFISGLCFLVPLIFTTGLMWQQVQASIDLTKKTDMRVSCIMQKVSSCCSDDKTQC